MTKEEKAKVQQRRSAIFGGGVQALRNKKRGPLGGWLLLVVALLVTVIVVPKGGLIPDYHAPGEVAPRNIKSPRDLLVEDVRLTEAKRAEAVDAVPLVYEFNSSSGLEAINRIASGLDLLIQYHEVGENQDKEAFLLKLEADFGVPLTSDEYRPLIKLPLSRALVAETVKVLKPIFTLPVVASLPKFQSDRIRGLSLFDRKEERELKSVLLDQTIGLNEALSRAEGELSQIPDISGRQKQTLLKLVQQQLRPNLIFSQQLTDQSREDAATQIAPVLFQVKKGEMIVREGERVSDDQILKLRAIRDSGRDSRSLQTAAGLIICILLLLYVGFFFAQENISKFNLDSRDLVFLATVFLGQFVLIKVSIVLSAGMGNTFTYFDSSVYYYAMPFALGAMLVRIVLNSEIALLFAVCWALFVGVLFGNSLMIALYTLTGSLVAAHGVRHCQARSTLYRAGLWLGLTNIVLVLGIHFLSGRAFELELLWKLGFGFFGGLASAILLNGTIPLVESFFKYTTDIKLLELANMNAPILRQLMIEAPGTYHHSILVGNLAESAAESINANPLLARVSAYYHDIGKIKKPLYFIENSGGQRNKHDKLSPSMSALILTSHVKDGVELAREHKLGSELIDVIQQHHGTALIKFFYDRARNQADPEVQQIDERDYRYHGPKPQTREAALIMLADAVEAASRTLTDPTPARIKGMVQKLINAIFSDGQLNECDLTLKDLNQIGKSFSRVLSGSFHHRVDYPEPVHIVREKLEVENKLHESEKVKLKSANSDRKSAEKKSGPEETSTQNSAKNLKRTGVP